jgi:hypothetical protein
MLQKVKIFFKNREKSFEHFYDIINYLCTINHISIINDSLNIWIKNNLILVFIKVKNSNSMTNIIIYQRFDNEYHFSIKRKKMLLIFKLLIF